MDLVMVAAKSAGQAVGGFFNNPSIFALAAIGIGLFLFRDKISDFFSKITGGAEGAAAVGETASILGGNLTSNLTLTPLDTDPLFGKEGFFTNFSENFFGFLGEQQSNLDTFFDDSQKNLDNIFQGGSDFLGDIGKTITDAIDNVTDIFEPREESTDITETPAAEGRASDRGRNIIETISADLNNSVQSQIDNQQFQGGGISFQGGVVRETPIEFLSLGQIIDRFDVTASQAADIRARASDDFGDFDFGTNIGASNITDAIAEIQNIGAVSDLEFEGLTAEEIALRLTGGVISNF